MSEQGGRQAFPYGRTAVIGDGEDDSCGWPRPSPLRSGSSPRCETVKHECEKTGLNREQKKHTRKLANIKTAVRKRAGGGEAAAHSVVNGVQE